MIKKIRGIKIELIIISIALFVLGLFLTIFPEVSQIIICRAVGIALCVWGVLRLMTYFRMSREDVFVSFGLVQGISLLAFGIFFVMRPEAIAVFFGTAIAIIIIIDGILKSSVCNRILSYGSTALVDRGNCCSINGCYGCCCII